MNRGYLICLAASVCALMSTSCSEKESVSESASIEMSLTTVKAAAEGGTYSVAYQITNSGGGTVEAVSPDTWVNSWNYSVDGVISFNVDPNIGADRQTTVTVLYADAIATFTVSQPDPKKLHEGDLENAWWTATVCDFDMSKTIFYYVNPESQGEFYYNPVTGRHYITAGEYATNYVNAYNVANPDAEPMSIDDALSFTFTESEEFTTFYNVGFYEDDGEPYIVIEDGMITPGGAVSIVRANGKYTFDAETGTIVVEDTANTMYTREVTIHVERSGENLILQVTSMPWQDYMAGYLVHEDEGLGQEMMTADHFGFTLSNYGGTEAYAVYGSLVYTLRYDGPVSEEE